MKKILIASLLIVLVSCTVPPESSPISQTDTSEKTVLNNAHIGLGVTRIVDSEAGVACWIYKGIEKAGISCLPISQTLLNTE